MLSPINCHTPPHAVPFFHPSSPRTMKPPAFLPSLPLSSSTASLHIRACPRHSPPTQSALASPPPPLHPPHPPSPSSSKALHLHAPSLTGRSALTAALSALPPDRLLLVFFHARWCRVCKTLASKLPTITRDYQSIEIRSVDFADRVNKPLCSELGVKLLPTFRVYRAGMSISDKPLEQFTTGPFGVQRLKERLEELKDKGLLL